MSYDPLCEKCEIDITGPNNNLCKICKRNMYVSCEKCKAIVFKTDSFCCECGTSNSYLQIRPKLFCYEVIYNICIILIFTFISFVFLMSSSNIAAIRAFSMISGAILFMIITKVHVNMTMKLVQQLHK